MLTNDVFVPKASTGDISGNVDDGYDHRLGLRIQVREHSSAESTNKAA